MASYHSATLHCSINSVAVRFDKIRSEEYGIIGETSGDSL